MRVYLFFVSLLLAATASRGQNQEKQATSPHVVVIGVNGMELDVIRPLLLKGAMPNLEHVINNTAAAGTDAMANYASLRGLYIAVADSPPIQKEDAAYFEAWIDRMIAAAKGFQDWNSS